MALPPPSNRRQFLVGRAAGDVLAYFVEDAAERIGQLVDQLDPPQPEVRLTSYVSVLRRQSMACQFELRFNIEDTITDQGKTAAGLAALDLIETLEEQLTVYRSSSEVCHINRTAADSPVEVEANLFNLLAQAEQVYHDTHGAFDLTCGPLSRIWGFHSREGRLPTEEEIASARNLIGWNNVRLDRQTGQISFTKRGTEINVNSIGKGYALDRAATLLNEQGVTDFLFHGGRSTLIACGDRSGERGWPAGLRHPNYPSLRLALFRLKNEALSTSGSATQYFRYRGKRYGHLIDPRTGWPAAGLHSVTVIAPTAAQADALSTAFYIMGRHATIRYCRQQPHLKVLMVIPTAREGEIEIECLNLEDHEWQPTECNN